MHFLEKIKLVIKSPSKFYKNISHERGFRKPFVYFALLSIVFAIGNLASEIVYPSVPSVLLASIHPWIVYLLAPVGWLFSLVASFLVAAIFHVFVYMLGGKQGYLQTYKSYVYGTTPHLLLGWVPFLGMLTGLYSMFYLLPKGLSIQQKMSMGRAVAVVVVPIVIFVALILAVVGLAYFTQP